VRVLAIADVLSAAFLPESCPSQIGQNTAVGATMASKALAELMSAFEERASAAE
jgi:hypothetical protein